MDVQFRTKSAVVNTRLHQSSLHSIHARMGCRLVRTHFQIWILPMMLPLAELLELLVPALETMASEAVYISRAQGKLAEV